MEKMVVNLDSGYTFEYKEMVMTSYLTRILAFFKKAVWLDDSSFKIKGVGKVVMVGLIMNVEGGKIVTFVQKLEKLRLLKESKKITETKAKKSVFKQIFEKPHFFNGIEYNTDIFNFLNVELSKKGVADVLVDTTFSVNDSFKKHLTIAISCNTKEDAVFPVESGFKDRLKTFFLSKYKGLVDEDCFLIPNTNWLKFLETESVEDILLEDMLIGRYYKERNLIHLYYNPFILAKTSFLESEIPLPLLDFVSIIKSLNLVKFDIKKIKRKLFITAFLANSRKRIKEIQGNKKDISSRIKESEIKIRKGIKQIYEEAKELTFLNENIRSDGLSMFKEFDMVSKLPFVKRTRVGSDYFSITFKEATLKIPDFGRSDHGAKFGIRTVYLGELSVKISSSAFVVSSNHPFLFGRPHPHADSGGQPCFGGGVGKSKIYELLAQNNFSELAKMLWFWIKTYRNEGAYDHMWDVYDERLQQGLPVWDEKGVRINLNEEKRIDAGEQVVLDPVDGYESNIKKFKNKRVF